MQSEQWVASINSIYKYIPLASAAVDTTTCSPDRELLLLRVSLLGAGTLAAFGASLTIGLTLFPPALVVSAIVLPAFYIILIQDLNLAETASDTEAANQYIQRALPSSYSIRRIMRSVTCALEVIKHTRDISKISEANIRILDPIHLKKEIFKLFVDFGVNVFIKDKDDIPYIVDFEDPSFIEYALEKTPTITASLTKKETIKCFQHIRNPDSISILKKFGFDINIQDSSGYTPLLKCIRYADRGVQNNNRSGLSYDKVIQALLTHGADPHMGIIYRGRQYNARQFNRNPIIAKILHNY